MTAASSRCQPSPGHARRLARATRRSRSPGDRGKRQLPTHRAIRDGRVRGLAQRDHALAVCSASPGAIRGGACPAGVDHAEIVPELQRGRIRMCHRAGSTAAKRECPRWPGSRVAFTGGALAPLCPRRRLERARRRRPGGDERVPTEARAHLARRGATRGRPAALARGSSRSAIAIVLSCHFA